MPWKADALQGSAQSTQAPRLLDLEGRKRLRGCPQAAALPLIFPCGQSPPCQATREARQAQDTYSQGAILAHIPMQSGSAAPTVKPPRD